MAYLWLIGVVYFGMQDNGWGVFAACLVFLSIKIVFETVYAATKDALGEIEQLSLAVASVMSSKKANPQSSAKLEALIWLYGSGPRTGRRS